MSPKNYDDILHYYLLLARRLARRQGDKETLRLLGKKQTIASLLKIILTRLDKERLDK